MNSKRTKSETSSFLRGGIDTFEEEIRKYKELIEQQPDTEEGRMMKDIYQAFINRHQQTIDISKQGAQSLESNRKDEEN